MSEKTKLHYFLVTDRKSLDRGHVSINPIPISVNGKLEYLGDAVIPIVDYVIKVEDDGSKTSFARLKSINARDGIIEITEKLVEKIITLGMEMGVLETGDEPKV